MPSFFFPFISDRVCAQGSEKLKAFLEDKFKRSLDDRVREICKIDSRKMEKNFYCVQKKKHEAE